MLVREFSCLVCMDDLPEVEALALRLTRPLPPLSPGPFGRSLSRPYGAYSAALSLSCATGLAPQSMIPLGQKDRQDQIKQAFLVLPLVQMSPRYHIADRHLKWTKRALLLLLPVSWKEKVMKTCSLGMSQCTTPLTGRSFSTLCVVCVSGIIMPDASIYEPGK